MTALWLIFVLGIAVAMLRLFYKIQPTSTLYSLTNGGFIVLGTVMMMASPVIFGITLISLVMFFIGLILVFWGVSPLIEDDIYE